VVEGAGRGSGYATAARHRRRSGPPTPAQPGFSPLRLAAMRRSTSPDGGGFADFVPHFSTPMHYRIRLREKFSSSFPTAFPRPVCFSHPVAREGRSAGDLAAAGCDRAGLSGGADYSPGPGCGALSAPARSGPRHRLAPRPFRFEASGLEARKWPTINLTRAHRGLWQNGHAGRQPSSKRYLSILTPGDGPAPRALPLTPRRRALQPVRRSGACVMTRPRPPRPAPVDPLDRALEEAEAEAERIEKRRLLAVLRRNNARWRAEHSPRPQDSGF